VRGAVTTPDATVLESRSLVLASTGLQVTGRRGICLVDGAISLTDGRSEDRSWAAGDQRLLVDCDEPGDLESLLPRMRGEFILILHRRGPDELVLIRDQFGARPLFLHREGPRLVFASEVRDLLTMLGRTPAPDDVAVVSWLQSGLVPPGRTFYRSVTPLRPAHVLRVGELATHETRYWDPRYRTPQRISRADVDELLRSGIERAIRRRIPRHGPVGIMLGGGIDASTVAAFTRRLEGPERELVAYSAVFPEHPSVDESGLIEATTRVVGMRASRLPVSRGSLLAGAIDFIGTWRLPVGPPTHGFMRTLVARSADDGMAVLLDGEGGDETFGASPYLIGRHLRRGRIDLAFQVARRPSGTGLYLNPAQMVRFAWNYGLDPANRSKRPVELGASWLLPEPAGLLEEITSGSGWASPPGPNWWRWLSWTLVRSREFVAAQDFFRRQSNGRLPRRHPFLDDVDLLELVLSLPPEAAHHPELTRPTLRRLTAGLLPDEVRLRRTKTVWNEVLDRAVEGVDRAPTARLLLDPRAEIRRYVDVSAIRSALANGNAKSLVPGQIRHHELWRVAVMESWLRALDDPRFLDDARGTFGTDLALGVALRH
jgi:asparagine synthase (glutamine-hydrolysing)